MNANILIAGIAMFLLTIGAGVYSQQLGTAENIGFQVAVPAGTVTAPTLVKGNGPPVNMAPITVNLAGRGFPKMLFNGGIERIESHRITNVGKKPVRIKMELVNGTNSMWGDVQANTGFNRDTSTFTEPLMPGKSIPNLGMDWYFGIPREKLYDPVVYDGGLRFTDADSGELLTFLPIKIVNRDPSAAASGNSSGTEEASCH